MKIKKILSSVVAGTLALSTLAGMSLTSSAVDEATPLKTWMSDASTKNSAWASGFDSDPFAFGGDKDADGNPVAIPADLSKAKSFEVTLKTPTDNINGSFGVGTGADFTWASADWSINYDFDEEMWVLDGSDDASIVVSASETLPGEGNVYTITYTDLEGVLGAAPSKGATAEFKINGYNRIGEKKAWLETPVELMTLKVYDENGVAIVDLPASEVEDPSSSEVESSEDESSETPAPAPTTVIKNWTSDASTKNSAWASGFDADPFAFGGDKDADGNSVAYPFDWSQAMSLEVKLATPTDNINGSFGVGTGEDFTWASADWSINYDFDEAAWVLDGSDDASIVTSASAELPGEGNVYTITYTDLPAVLGAAPSSGATAEFKLNGFNRIGEKKAWLETPVDLISVVVKDADGNVIFSLPTDENDSSSEEESSEPESSEDPVEVEPSWTANGDGTFTLATHYLKDSKDNNSLSIDPADIGITDPSKVRAITVKATTTGANAYYAWGIGADAAAEDGTKGAWTQAWNDEDTPDSVTVEFPNGLFSESWPYFQTSWNNKGENTMTISFEVTYAEEAEYVEDATVVKYQTANGGDTVRFVYIADEATVAAATTGSVELRTDAGVVGPTEITTAYRAIKANGQTVKAADGKVFIISPVVENVETSVTGIFALEGAAKVGRTYTK